MSDRRAFDFYETPPAVTEELVARLAEAGLELPGPILEPCVGDHAIANVVADRNVTVYTNDIDRNRAADYHMDAGDAASWATWHGLEIHTVISNPPFSEAPRIVPLAVASGALVIMLLRITFMEPVENRRDFLSARPPQHQLTTERISFRKSAKGSNTDSVTTAWFIWTQDRQPLPGIAPHEVLRWKARWRAEKSSVAPLFAEETA